jgi:VanZ family protein
VPHLDKVGHAAAFAVLAILASVVISQFRPVAFRGLLAVALGLAVYAGLDEYTQGWVPLRTPDPLDWMADVAGILAGILLFVLIRRVLCRSASDPTAIAKSPPS